MKLLDKGYKFFWNKIVAGNDAKRMAKQSLPDGIVAVVDIPYVDDEKKEHLLDIYYPEGTDSPLPVIIDIHGGGLMYAYKELNKNYCYNLAKRGFVVINVSYSLAPDNKYPACLHDVCNALKWINRNTSNYFIDKNRIYITGDSAGGLLAALCVVLSKKEKLRIVYGIDCDFPTIRAAGLTSGMFDYDKGLAKLLSSGIFGKGGWKKYEHSEYLPFENIIESADDFVPAFLVTSAEDMIHGASVNFKRLLDERGIENEYLDYPKGKINKLEHVFSVLYPTEYEESVETIDRMVAFFNKH